MFSTLSWYLNKNNAIVLCNYHSVGIRTMLLFSALSWCWNKSNAIFVYCHGVGIRTMLLFCVLSWSCNGENALVLGFVIVLEYDNAIVVCIVMALECEQCYCFVHCYCVLIRTMLLLCALLFCPNKNNAILCTGLLV